MKNVKTLFLFMLIPLCFLLGGCKSKTDNIVGYWKSTIELDYITYDKYEVVHIQDKYISFDGESEIPIVWSNIKDHLIANKKDSFGFDFSLEIEIIDKDNIRIKKEGFPRRNGKFEQYVRITKEEMENIIKTPGKKHEYKVW